MWRTYLFAVLLAFPVYFGAQALGLPTALVLILTLVGAMSGAALGAYLGRPR